MNEDIEEILEEADNLKINLKVMDEAGLYYPQNDSILLNPCVRNEKEFGETFLHEMFHHWAQMNNVFLSKELEEYHAEKFAQRTYIEHKEAIDKYLRERKLR